MNLDFVSELLLLVLASGWILLLPGLAILAWIPRRPGLKSIWIFALGLGLAVNPIIFQFLSLLGLPFNRLTLVLVGIVFLLLLVLKIALHVRDHGISDGRLLSSKGMEWVAAYILLFLAVFFLRWSSLTELTVLPGIDSNQHAVISSLFVNNEGIPSDYLPYAPLSSFTYHFGIHANTAALSIATGLPVHRVLIFLEPFFIAMVSMTTLVLARTITKNRYTALAAAGIVGFVSVFPAWYLNWARLPQLGGVVLLPLVLAEIAREHDAERYVADRATIALLAAGLFLTHYRMAIVLVYGLIGLFAWRLAFPDLRKNILAGAKALGSVLFLTLILVAPWIFRLYSSFQYEIATGAPIASMLPPPYYYSFERIGYVNSVATTSWLPIVVAAGFIMAALRKRRELIFLLTWAGLQLAFSNPYLLPLPWSGLVDFVTVTSIIFIPMSIIAAYAVSIPVTWKSSSSESIGSLGIDRRLIFGLIDRRLLFALVLSLLIVVGSVQTVDIVQTRFTYVFQEDMEAFNWIASETPRDAVFLTALYISPIEIVEPTDAGVWISYFTSRQQVAPPLIYRTEKSFSENYEAELRELVFLQKNIDQFDSYKQLVALGITHIYYGKKAPSSIDISRLDAAIWYELVYDRNGVRIYELKPLSLFESQ
jgi:hypothetical protein